MFRPSTTQNWKSGNTSYNRGQNAFTQAYLAQNQDAHVSGAKESSHWLMQQVEQQRKTMEASEEQEAQLDELPMDSKTVEQRLKQILQSYLQQGKYSGKAEVDTMEFRPSDARKGEFGRIPF